MATYSIEIPANKEIEFLNFISKFEYVKIQNRTKIKEQFKRNLEEALKEVDAMESGNLAQMPIESLLQELRDEKGK
ncbi:MAG: hypothetical protein HW421_290 [Ignavibacteria bacterium]|nr:hypothetical protein [Ignavibacteria bacterium]